MMTKEGSIKIVIFITPRARVLVLRHDHMHYFFKNLLFLLPGIDQTN